MSNVVLDYGWQSEPPGRGTYSILLTCLSTIFICVWTAYHPDVPLKPKRSSDHFIVNLGNRAVALLIPKKLAWDAINQWATSREVLRRVRRFEEGRKWTSLKEGRKWTMTQASLSR